MRREAAASQTWRTRRSAAIVSLPRGGAGMSGVFLSYSRADRAVAGQIVRGLRALGVEVWWDEDMRGVDWQDELARQIAVLDAVVVLWTHNSVGSMHVKDEARLARDNNKLI